MKGPIDYGHKADGRGDSRGHYNNGQNHHYHHHGQPQQGSGDGSEFAEFLWMAEENLEEFDRKCELEFWEEQFIESCFEEMWQEEQRTPQGAIIPTQQNIASVPHGRHPAVNPASQAAARNPANNNPRLQPVAQQQAVRGGVELAGLMQGLNIEEHNQKNTVMSSTLNPNAPEFVPRGGAVDFRSSADR